jgi:hypothetical protein
LRDRAGAARKDDRYHLNIDRIRALGWSDTTRLEDGIAEMIKWVDDTSRPCACSDRIRDRAMSKTCIILGSNSDIAKGLIPLLGAMGGECTGNRAGRLISNGI